MDLYFHVKFQPFITSESKVKMGCVRLHPSHRNKMFSKPPGTGLDNSKSLFKFIDINTTILPSDTVTTVPQASKVNEKYLHGKFLN